MATVSPAHADSVVFMGCRAERGGINWPLCCWAGRRCSLRSDHGCLASAVAGTLVDPSSTQQSATAHSGRASLPAQSYREFAPFDPQPSTVAPRPRTLALHVFCYPRERCAAPRFLPAGLAKGAIHCTVPLACTHAARRFEDGEACDELDEDSRRTFELRGALRAPAANMICSVTFVSIYEACGLAPRVEWHDV